MLNSWRLAKFKSDFHMRTCYIDVKNHVVKKYSMTWENVDDTFLSEKSCFQNSMIPNIKKKKKRYFCFFTCACVGRQTWLLYWQPMAPPGTLSPASRESSSLYPSQVRVIIPMALGIFTKISGMSGGVPCSKCKIFPSGHSGNTFFMRQDSYSVD